ncbi:hypothetical protein PLESTB_000570300 [Pleodorina starrii]|uniref:Uncharacterized protein n=1 Tax=Pleodorina starrii TaxID=330485 RepID=A0A9W6F0M6_9CHLO|nr:hypothetical protein PLESTB_000570300 [Pleodorina starrii]
MAFADEPWKLSLRKYPYPGRATSPGRRSRSASPAKRRSLHAKASISRHVLQEIMERLNSTQGDLHALALKVAVWSREAALLSEGIKEEALLLEVGRQADRLAASEAQRREARKQERVYRLSMENCELRRELRDLIRVVKLLLDRRALDRERDLDRALAAEAAATAGGGGSRAATPSRLTPARRKAWEEDDAAAAAAPQTPRAKLPYFSASYAAAAPSTPRARRGYSYGGSYDSYSVAAGLEGLTDENAPYFVAADRAQADADAVLNRLSARRATGASRSRSGGGGGGGTHYVREIAAQRDMFEREMAQDRKQVNTALAAMDQALHDLTLGFQYRNRSGGGAARGSSGAGAAAAPPPQAWAATAPRSASPSFGGFLPREGEVMIAEVTPVLPEGWRRRQRIQEEAEAESRRLAEMERVRVRLAVAERELAEAVAEAAEAEAAEDAAEAAEAEAVEEEEEVIATPTKLAASAPVPAPPTPIYQGVSYGVPVRGGGGVGSAASYSRLHSAGGFGGGGGGRAPLDSVLTVEVDKLKRINKALATTLVSYNRVASRLDDASAEMAAPITAAASAPPPAAGSGAARALFINWSPAASAAAGGGVGGGISLAAVPPPPAHLDAASVATTYASSVHTAVPFTYTPSYPLGVSARAVAAPLTPPAAVRHLRPDEGRVVSWAPSLVTPPPPPRDRPYSVGGAAAEARRLHSSLDTQLYGIRQQLQALRTDMVADRLAALAASAPGAAAAAASPHDAVKLSRLEAEVSELRRQVQDDRVWYRDSLDCVVSERSAAFRDLQRRIDRLMNNAI